MSALVGDVEQFVGGRWRVVLAASAVPVTDRRRRVHHSAPAFGPGSPAYRAPRPPRNPHTRTWRPGQGWTDPPDRRA